VSLALDSSATLAWIFGDETNGSIEEVFEMVANYGAYAPSLWRLEVANSLTMALRRGRIDLDFRNAALADLSLLDVRTDPETDARAWEPTLELGDRFGLTLYDTAYVELAHRRKLPLATLDTQMRIAGDALGLRLLGVPEA
jgi:predicted nucleic acid-binding protein